jgi:hypothetical protein
MVYMDILEFSCGRGYEGAQYPVKRGQALRTLQVTHRIPYDARRIIHPHVGCALRTDHLTG